MTEELQALLKEVTCKRCLGNGTLHSVAAKWIGEPGWHTHLKCEACDGCGITKGIKVLQSCTTPTV